jgi:hypothetical protein
MKNADRINFYIAGLRQPGTPQTADAGKNLAGLSAESGGKASSGLLSQPHAEVAAVDTPSVNTAAFDTPEAPPPLPGSLTLHSKLPLTAGGQRIAAPDQMQLHRLLVQLNSGRQRLDEQPTPSPEATRKRHRRLVLGLILALCIIAAQATAVVWLYQRAELLLGRPLSPALLMAASADDLNVIFRASADAGDVAVLLRELDLRVVDGPNAASRYVLRPEIGTDSKHALNALRDRRDLVYSADPAY